MRASGCSPPARSIWAAERHECRLHVAYRHRADIRGRSGGFVARVGLDGLPDSLRRALERCRHAVLRGGRLRRALARRALGLRLRLLGSRFLTRAVAGRNRLRRALAGRPLGLRLLVGRGALRSGGLSRGGHGLGLLRRPLAAALRLRLLLARAVAGLGRHDITVRIGVAPGRTPPARRLRLLDGRLGALLDPDRGDRLHRRLRLARALALLAPPLPAPALALREVAQQLARQRRRLARHAGAGTVDDLAGLGRVRERGRQQRRGEPPVLLPRRVDQPPRVARVGAAGRVHEQPQQALRLRPPLHGVFLVHLARHLRARPDPVVRLVAPPDLLLRQRLQHDLDALALLFARPGGNHLDRAIERLGVARRGDLLQRADPQLRVLVAVDGGQQEGALELAALVEVQHRPRPPPAGRSPPGAGQRGPLDLLAVVEVLDGDPPQL